MTNPLNKIDINSPDARGEVMRLALELIPNTERPFSKEQHFQEISRVLLAAYIAHVISFYPAKYHHLPAVFNLIIFGEPEGVTEGENLVRGWRSPALDIASNPRCNGLVKEAAVRFNQLQGNELSGMQSTLHRSLSWVKDETAAEWKQFS